MAEPVKSVLLVDLDGVGRSLAASSSEAVGERLTERIGDWSGAIESGELIEPAGTLRAISTRRCYAGSASADEARDAFARAGFEMVNCDGQAQADLSLALDAMDAAADAGEGLDFILLTAAPDLTPLVERLRARGHRVAIYASEATAANYRAAADMVIQASAFAAFLATSKPSKAVPAVASADRAKIEAFAREVHAATNIPMFSPKTFADLFRFLANEVAQQGYHFNDTAKSVAARLTEAGRNVTSRQVVFVVKGLALKGHVFSTSDTAAHLAEVFREQARYLIAGAGINLDAEREALLAAWIAASPAAPDKPARPAQASAAPAKPAPKTPPADDDKPAARKAPPPARRPEKPTAAKPATPPRVPERPKSSALPAKAAPSPAQLPKPDRSSADLRATIAARIAASARMKPSARPPADRDGAPPPRDPAANAEPGDSIESSILAAIAEAVDVLVEDGSARKPAPRAAAPDREAEEPAPRRAAADRPPPAEPPAPAEEEEGGDIGDEIQRIVASYNRNRDDGGRR
jgi:hypothetical protein